MTTALARRVAALPTAAKLLLFLSAALLPIGATLVWLADSGIERAGQAIVANADSQGNSAARSIESLIARNALALRVAANGAMRDSSPEACARAAMSLAIVPGVARRFALTTIDGTPLCTVGSPRPVENAPLVAPGDIALWIGADRRSVDFRVGIIGGMATGTLETRELRTAAEEASSDIERLVLSDGQNEMDVIERRGGTPSPKRIHVSRRPLGSGRLTVLSETRIPRINISEQLLILLPMAMWVIAALISWLLVTRLLIDPLRKLQAAIGDFTPGSDTLVLPENLGPAVEIRDLGNAFVRAVDRIDESERQMAEALEGQRRLVREVHHRVKNNLQVIASLLNIHGRSVHTPDARAAYAAISRRVDAMAVVHRNHFAELEESRGIALVPLVTELSVNLRAGAPDEARSVPIELQLDSLSTTQDVAIAVAFLMTEIVEYAILNHPADLVEIALRRTGELTARLDFSSPVLNPDQAGNGGKAQFERIIAGLARQLRSPLERRLGRYSVDLPVFPTR